jgi:hypothetical protein
VRDTDPVRIEDLRGTPVLVVDGDGPTIGVRQLGDLLSAAFEGGAATVAIDARRLDPAFFDLRSGVAGEMVQRFANYRLRLAVAGELPAEARESRSFRGFVVEGSRGDGPWFVASLAELADRLSLGG